MKSSKMQCSGDKNNTVNSASGSNRKCFETYWTSFNGFEKAAAQGSVIKAPLRVNPKNYKQLYVSHPDGDSDVFIDSSGAFNDRNRALNGDIVTVSLFRQRNWRVNVSAVAKIVNEESFSNENNIEQLPTEYDFLRDESYPTSLRVFVGQLSSEQPEFKTCLIRTGKVVAILEKRHSYKATGHLLFQNKKVKSAFFIPNDSRVPRVMVQFVHCPVEFLENPSNFEKILCVVEICDWSETSQYPQGKFVKFLGEDGNLDAVTEGILLENGIVDQPFTDEVIQSCSQEFSFTEHLKGRRDLRDVCVFTIDPSTARDLDDALHCEALGDDIYEVGVHIADVSHFVPYNSEIDVEAAKRATSTYLVSKMIPMLPRQLCENLCSLQPGVDRLTISVIWKMTANGEILDTWFGRTVIKSCIKLSYDNVQEMLENPEKTQDSSSSPSSHSFADIVTRILLLNRIAQALKKKSLAEGSLNLHKPKLHFRLDAETKQPISFEIETSNESHQLVQEFMLLANRTVAQRISSLYPDKAILRRHSPPPTKLMLELKAKCEKVGITLDVQSSGTIQASLDELAGRIANSEIAVQAIINLCSKPMKNAEYFCLSSSSDTHHYALNTPLYTHFTSPIRRYVDIMVHRQLLASIDTDVTLPQSDLELHGQAGICNERKLAAKRASEQIIDLYTALYLQNQGPLNFSAVVLEILDYSFDIFITDLCAVKRLYTQTLDGTSVFHRNATELTTVTVTWPPTASNNEEIIQTIHTFDVIQVSAMKGDKPLTWMVTLQHPGTVTMTTPSKSTEEMSVNDNMLTNLADLTDDVTLLQM